MNQLQKKLKPRHLAMISIGGVIGAGLFVGSGAVVHATGPGAVLSYMIAGLLVVLVMRMLGEMAVVNPDSGSFATYAQQSMGPLAGFTIGWLYWFYWAIVIAIEATAGAAIVHGWIPFVPVWVISLVLTLLLTVTNIFSVKSFGEFEYWFALIKVAAICLFMGLGAAIILGFIPWIPSPGTNNLLHLGGFLPKGFSAVFVGIVVCIFSFFGAEIAAVAAGETENPRKSVILAIRSVVWRILLFYIGSVAILVTLLPWNAADLLQSPYVTLLEMLKIPAAAQTMNVVVLISVLSCLNSALYTNSRMLLSLAQRGKAPRCLTKINKGGVPIRALFLSTVFSYICALFHYISPDKIFLFLVNASGAISILVYISIAVSHLILRKRIEKNNGSVLKLKMWLFPALTYVTIASMIAILIAMWIIESMRSQLLLTLTLTGGLIAFYYLFMARKPSQSLEGKKHHTECHDS